MIPFSPTPTTPGSAVRAVSKYSLLEGTLLAQKIYPDGTKETCWKETNLIMLPAKQRMLSLIYQTSPVSVDPISTLKVGTGGSIDSLGLYPKSPTQDMTNLYTYLLGVPVTFLVDNTVPMVTYIADLDQGTGNGNLITEAGLFTTQANMFNIKVFPGIPKTSEFNLHFEWTIKLV